MTAASAYPNYRQPKMRWLPAVPEPTPVAPTAAAVDALRRARARGLDVSAAVSVPHLSFSEDAIAGYRTFYKMAPPLRAEADRQAMVEALE
ncbi:MAG: hypothetical protein AAFW48_21715, partial [Pseudomonadota bacterium]